MPDIEYEVAVRSNWVLLSLGGVAGIVVGWFAIPALLGLTLRLGSTRTAALRKVPCSPAAQQTQQTHQPG